MKELQEKVKEFCEVHKLECPLEFRFLDLVSELGELAKEIIKSTITVKKNLNLEKKLKANWVIYSFPWL